MNKIKNFLLCLILICSVSFAYALNKDSHDLGTVVSGGGSGDVSSIETTVTDNSVPLS